jgi:hypothetical protein
VGGWVGGCIHHTSYVTADKGNVSSCVVSVHSSDSRSLPSHGWESYRKSDQNLNLFQRVALRTNGRSLERDHILHCITSGQRGKPKGAQIANVDTSNKANKANKNKQTNKQITLVARAALVKTQYFHWASRSAASPEQLNASNVVSFGVSPSVMSTARVVNVKLFTWIGAASTHRYLFPTELPPRIGQSADSLPSASVAVSLNARTLSLTLRLKRESESRKTEGEKREETKTLQLVQL